MPSLPGAGPGRTPLVHPPIFICSAHRIQTLGSRQPLRQIVLARHPPAGRFQTVSKTDSVVDNLNPGAIQAPTEQPLRNSHHHGDETKGPLFHAVQGLYCGSRAFWKSVRSAADRMPNLYDTPAKLKVQ